MPVPLGVPVWPDNTDLVYDARLQRRIPVAAYELERRAREFADKGDESPSRYLLLERRGDEWVRVGEFDEDEISERPATPPRERQADEPPRQAKPAAPPPEQPATLLVFRDGRRREIRDYAIVRGTLWHLTRDRAFKIPLSQLDLDATIKANHERGIDFRLPKSRG